MSRLRKVRRAAFVLLVNVVVAVLMLEVTIFALLRMPSVTSAAPLIVREFAQKVYRHFQRNIIQYDADCAQYDAGLGYTLKPGTCTFGNLEFSNEFHINTQGLRDDEATLAAPEIVFLGDSQVMGWAVAQHEAMPQALARHTGLRVLNAGISSYGTVRERLLLDRLDLSNLRAIVVQYCDNDIVENQVFSSNGNVLPVMTEARYREASEQTRADAGYYPGKYSFRLVLKALQLEEPEADIAQIDPNLTPADEARLFINALVHAGQASLEGIPIITFEINSNLARRRTFVDALSHVKADPVFPAFIRDMRLIETEGLLDHSDFFVLDDHMTVAGNDKVASMVAAVLSELGIAAGAERESAAGAPVPAAASPFD